MQMLLVWVRETLRDLTNVSSMKKTCRFCGKTLLGASVGLHGGWCGVLGNHQGRTAQCYSG